MRAKTAPGPAVCSRCGAELARVHSYHQRTVGDLPVDGRLAVVPGCGGSSARRRSAAELLASRFPACSNATNGEPPA